MPKNVYLSMKNLIQSLDTVSSYEAMPLKELVSRFEKFTGQSVPQEAVDKFRLSGLLNVDLVTSDFLKDWELMNIHEFGKQ